MEKVSLKEINKLALPAIIAGISEPIMSMADTAIVGNMPINSTEGLAAIGTSSSFYLIIIWVLAQTKSAISAIVSKYCGAKDLGTIKSLIPQAIFLNILLGIIFYTGTIFFTQPIFEFYNLKGIELSYAKEYYEIRAIGFPFILAAFSIFGIFRGLQNTKWAMVISITGASFNILFDFIFVYGIEGIFPAMNVKGAAIASLLSQIIIFMLAVIYLFKKTDFNLKLSKKINKELPVLIKLSLNLFLRTLALNVAMFVANKLTNGYGKSYNAAHQIAWQIWLFSAFFIDGYSSAGNAISGKLLGEKNYKDLINLSKKLTKYGILTGLCITLFGFIFYNFIGKIFTKEQIVLEEFNNVFWIVLISIPLSSVAFIFDGMFKGMGKMKFLRNILLVSTTLVFIPILLLLDSFEFRLKAIWVAFIMWIIARGLPLIVKFKKLFYPLVRT